MAVLMKWGSMIGFRTFLNDRRGNVVIPGSIIMVGFLGLVGSGLDMARIEMQRSDLQALTDASALAAVREMAISKGNADRIRFVASAQVQLRAEGRSIKADPVVDLNAQTLTVRASMPVKAVFPGPFSSVKHVTVTSTAQMSGASGNVCLIGLNPSAARTVYLDSNATLSAPNCSVYSNSKRKDGLVSVNNARLVGQDIFSAGGFQGTKSNIRPTPITDVQPINDPLASRATVPVGACDYKNFEAIDYVGTLSPGVYCGGLTIDGNSKVTLASGDYIIKDGPLRIDSNSEVAGDYVGFFLTGKNAVLNFSSNAKVTLSAPRSGALSGLLFFEDRANPGGQEHLITSNYARYMVGTIYLPVNKFRIDADQAVSDLSEYTVILAWELELNSGPNLFLNTDYHLSDIPVPEGVGPAQDIDARLVN